jgi:DNA-binding CsgD family transcriptional regulator
MAAATPEVEEDEPAISAKLPRPDELDVRRLAAHVVEQLSAGHGAKVDQSDGTLDIQIGEITYTVTPHMRAPSVTTLSPRETEIARLVAAGHTSKAIAVILEISIWTVSTHLRRIFVKLEVPNRASMVSKLLDHH